MLSSGCGFEGYIWVAVKIRVPFWVPVIIRQLLFMAPKKGTLILTSTHTAWGVQVSGSSPLRRCTRCRFACVWAAAGLRRYGGMSGGCILALATLRER